MAQTIGGINVRLAAETAQFTRNLDQAARTVNRATRDMRRAADQSSRAFNGMERSARLATRAAGALVAALSVRAVSNYTRTLLDNVNALADQADTLGLTAERLQRYQGVAAQVGVEQGRLNSAFEALNRRVGEARQGTGEFADVAERLGIDLSSTESAIAGVADAIAGAADQADAAAIANAAFGRAGSQVMRAMAGGAGELEDAMARVRVISEENARDVQAGNTALTHSMQQLGVAFQDAFLGQFAGGLEGLAGKMADLQPAFERLGQVAGQFVDLLIEGLPIVANLLGGVADAAAAVGDAFDGTMAADLTRNLMAGTLADQAQDLAEAFNQVINRSRELDAALGSAETAEEAETLVTHLRNAAAAQQEMAREAVELHARLERVIAGLEESGRSAEQFTGTLDTLESAMLALRDATNDAEAHRILAGYFRDTETAAEGATDAIEETTAAIETSGEAAVEAARRVGILTEAVEGLTFAQMQARAAALEAAAAALNFGQGADSGSGPVPDAFTVTYDRRARGGRRGGSVGSVVEEAAKTADASADVTSAFEAQAEAAERLDRLMADLAQRHAEAEGKLSLVGLTGEQLAAQEAHLQAIATLQREGIDLGSQAAGQYLDLAEATARAGYQSQFLANAAGAAMSGLGALARAATTDFENLGQVAGQVALSIADMFLQEGLSQIFGMLFSMGGSLFGSLFGGGGGGGGGFKLRGTGGLYHNGGIVGAGGPGRDLAGGLFGDEALGILKVGEEVLDEGDPRHSRNLPSVAMAGGGRAGMVQNFNVSVGVAQTVRAEILRLMPEFRRMSVRSVQEAAQRDPGLLAARGGA